MSSCSTWFQTQMSGASCTRCNEHLDDCKCPRPKRKPMPNPKYADSVEYADPGNSKKSGKNKRTTPYPPVRGTPKPVNLLPLVVPPVEVNTGFDFEAIWEEIAKEVSNEILLNEVSQQIHLFEDPYETFLRELWKEFNSTEPPKSPTELSRDDVLPGVF